MQMRGFQFLLMKCTRTALLNLTATINTLISYLYLNFPLGSTSMTSDTIVTGSETGWTVAPKAEITKPNKQITSNIVPVSCLFRRLISTTFGHRFYSRIYFGYLQNSRYCSWHHHWFNQFFRCLVTLINLLPNRRHHFGLWHHIKIYSTDIFIIWKITLILTLNLFN